MKHDRHLTVQHALRPCRTLDDILAGRFLSSAFYSRLPAAQHVPGSADGQLMPEGQDSIHDHWTT